MDEPIKKQTAALLKGGIRASQGTLLLYPDKLVHVGSAMAAAGVAGGALGALAGSALAKKRAEKKADEGGKGVTTISLSDIAGIHKAKQGLNKSLLGVQTSSGEDFKFGAKYD